MDYIKSVSAGPAAWAVALLALWLMADNILVSSKEFAADFFGIVLVNWEYLVHVFRSLVIGSLAGYAVSIGSGGGAADLWGGSTAWRVLDYVILGLVAVLAVAYVSYSESKQKKKKQQRSVSGDYRLDEKGWGPVNHGVR